MTLKEMLKEKEHYKKRVKELKEELDKYPPFLFFYTDDPMYDEMVKKHNNLFDYERTLEIIEELEKDYIPKDKIRKLEDMWNDNIWNATDESSKEKAEMIRDVYRGLLDE